MYTTYSILSAAKLMRFTVSIATVPRKHLASTRIVKIEFNANLNLTMFLHHRLERYF